MQAVILAAGVGKRLGRLSRSRSKPMQPVLGKPILWRIIETLNNAGFSEFLVVYNPHDDLLQRYFREPRSVNFRVRLIEQSEPLGTAHALSCVVPRLKGSFLLCACDNIVSSSDLERMRTTWESSKGAIDALLAFIKADPDEIRASAGVMLDHDRVVRIVEKPAVVGGLASLASIALYIFSERILAQLNHLQRSTRGEYELTHAIQRMIDLGGRVEGLELSGRLSLTRPEDLLSINLAFLQSMPSSPDANGSGGRGDVRIIQPVFIDQKVVIGEGSTIGPEVYLEEGCEIGAGCVIQRAVILKDVELPPGSTISDRVLYA